MSHSGPGVLGWTPWPVRPARWSGPSPGSGARWTTLSANARGQIRGERAVGLPGGQAGDAERSGDYRAGGGGGLQNLILDPASGDHGSHGDAGSLEPFADIVDGSGDQDSGDCGQGPDARRGRGADDGELNRIRGVGSASLPVRPSPARRAARPAGPASRRRPRWVGTAWRR